MQLGREVGIGITGSGGRVTRLDCFRLDLPPRLVFDILEAALASDAPRSLAVGAPGLRQVRVGQFQAQPPIVRVVVDLEEGGQPPPYRVAAGRTPEETLILFRGGGPVMLRLPSVQRAAEAVLLRLAGAGQLPRKVGVLSDPPRVYVDVTDAELEASQKQAFAEGQVAEIRMAQQADRDGRPVARFVVEMRQTLAHSIFEEGDDLVVALGEQPWALPLAKHEGAGRLQGRRVIVDPGHGGQKPGALGVDSKTGEVSLEKSITLDIGRRLGRLLAAEGAQVVMTRDRDVHVGLSQRALLANRMKADLFVSLHCNSCQKANTLHGTMVLYDHPHSARLAQLTQEELVSALGTEDKGIRNANFAVIRRTHMPGILVEVAFINHDGDRQRLLNANSRERAARAILQGVIRFCNDQPEGAPAT